MKEIILLLNTLNFANLDLLAVGVTIAAIGLLGFIVYISNTGSITSFSFLLFCAITMLWSFFNYLSYQGEDQIITLWLLRGVIFLGVWHSFSFFNFLYVFPLEKKQIPFWYKFLVFPSVCLVSLLTLSPFIFSGLESAATSESGPKAHVEAGIAIFLLTVFILIVSSFIFLIKRIVTAKKGEKAPYVLILVGAVITFILLFTFNLVLPAIFNNVIFIPLGAVTIFPFSIFTAYAIFKHKTFKVTHLGSSLMAFVLCLATFVEIIFAETYGQLVLRLGIFLFVLLISIQFVKNIVMLEKVTENLEEANTQLKSLDKLKSEFISLASHQLRSPLTVIKGYASTLTDGVVGEMNPKQLEITRHIYTSAQGLASVVEDFLNVTKIEQGGMKYVFEPTNIKQIVEDLANDMKIIAEDKNLSLTSVIDIQETCMVEADGVKLKQVFLNLIDNSIKYTKEGFVKISLTKNDSKKTIVFTVSDSGVGFSEETKKKLFTKFGRGEGSTLNTGGSGLGLYLAQEIVSAHHGEIKADSQGIGSGASFSVILPYIKL